MRACHRGRACHAIDVRLDDEALDRQRQHGEPRTRR
jgi:hypothetical protein